MTEENIVLDSSGFIDLSDFSTIRVDDVLLHVCPEIPAWIVTRGDETKPLDELNEKKSICSIVESGRHDLPMIENLLGRIISNSFLRGSVKQKSAPQFSLGIFITDQCNFDCKHCYLPWKNKGNLVNKSAMLDLIERSVKSNINEIIFMGAEPTLHPNFLLFPEFAKTRGMKTTVLTNGTFPNQPRYLDKLVENLDSIQIGIDGATEKVNDHIRSAGAYQSAIAAAKSITDRGRHVEIASILFKENIDDFLTNAPALLDNLGAGSYSFTITTGFIPERNRQLTITDDRQKMKLSAILRDLGCRVDDGSAAIDLCKKSCGFGENLQIQSNGDVNFRIDFDAARCANIYEDDFDSIMDGVLEARESSNVDNMPFCQDCEIRYVCGGACRTAEKKHFFPEISSGCNIKETMLRKMIDSVL